MKPVNISIVKPDLTYDGNLRGPEGYSTMGWKGPMWKASEAYDNKTTLLKCALRSIMDPPGGLNYMGTARGSTKLGKICLVYFAIPRIEYVYRIL